MRRRQLLATAGGCLGATLAGCAVPGAGGRHPFAGETLSVRVEVDSVSDHDLVGNAEEAMAYWNENASTYVGFEVSFVREDTDVGSDGAPDVVIAYVDEPSRCYRVENYSERVLGCAPMITANHRRVTRPATAIVVAGARPYGKIRVTTKHELGHILGLGHYDEPLEVMSHYPEHRMPLYAVRMAIWEQVIDAFEQSAAASTHFTSGVAAWNDEAYEAASWTFSTVAETFDVAANSVRGARDRTDEFEGHPSVETVDLPGLRGHLDHLVSRLDLASSFCATMAAASRAADDGDAELAADRRAEATEAISTFHELGSVELRDVGIALGLVTGFDRDEEFVPVEEGAPTPASTEA